MGPIYHVTLAYLELKQLPGSRALKVPEIRIDDRARAEIHQGTKVNPTQTTYSPLRCIIASGGRGKQSASITVSVGVGPFPSSFPCVCGPFELAGPGAG